MFSDIDRFHMARAVELARQGEGTVEPNPMVGCVIARGAEAIAEGWHRQFGGPHAEIEALSMADGRAAGATMYVTLEPCCHQGKTPPCTEAIIQAGIRRVVIAMRDPFPQVDGGGLKLLEAAGITTDVGLMESEARELNRPYLKLVESGRPWVIAKWAMTLCGKTATRTGSSRWISGEKSREVVHRLRGRVDAILVGSGTARCDDPELTVRLPAGQVPKRVPLRIVLDSRAELSLESRLVQTASELPLLVAVSEEASGESIQRLEKAGAEVFCCRGSDRSARLESLLDELGRRRMTNLLVEGGGEVVGTLLDVRAVDEVHVFIAPKLVGGKASPTPAGALGIAQMSDALHVIRPTIETLDSDIYLHGRIGEK
ncbi:MAG: bifunctional diaminohydroxyphosphoribosylaminopyrimidine deaminase/5-amino-6-(5-phosphoribosylamino)uracil reductase RibD [Planctomycetia bacterium]|jgi:diaminohydroxyphosphoribosylaminopyrimidine deaminase/5-amino-6-(5-phosphoribosylamino)uracil reductase